MISYAKTKYLMIWITYHIMYESNKYCKGTMGILEEKYKIEDIGLKNFIVRSLGLQNDRLHAWIPRVTIRTMREFLPQYLGDGSWIVTKEIVQKQKTSFEFWVWPQC